MVIALLLLAQIRIAPPQPTLVPVDPAYAFDLFHRVCFAPFPVGGAVEAALAKEGPHFVRWQPSSAAERLIPARVWLSPRALVSFTDSAVLPRDLPNPQCRVEFSAGAGSTVDQLAPLLASKLALGPGRVVGKRAYRTGMWDIAKPQGNWRVIMNLEVRAGQQVVKLSLLKLRR